MDLPPGVRSACLWLASLSSAAPRCCARLTPRHTGGPIAVRSTQFGAGERTGPYGEGGPLNWPPSADTVAGNGAPLNWPPSAHAVAGKGIMAQRRRWLQGIGERGVWAIVRLSISFPWTTLILAVVLAGVAVWYTSAHLEFETSRNALVSQKARYIQRFEDIDKDFNDL